jgi:hypothetical protein
MTQRHDRAKDVRNDMRNSHRNLYSANWWNRYPGMAHGRWHYYRNHAANHWWRWATWRGVTGWIAWQWATPVYYDYGTGGNVYYQNNTVYVDGEESCTAEEYAQQAGDLAAAAPEVADDKVEWMPLGVFALTHEEKGDPTMFLQLVVSKEGIISGTYTNPLTDTALPIEGMVDQKTQRAAWTIGDNKSTVMETGIYNLTKDEAPVLIHFGKDKTQTWLLVRLEEKKEEPASGQ